MVLPSHDLLLVHNHRDGMQPKIVLIPCSVPNHHKPAPFAECTVPPDTRIHCLAYQRKIIVFKWYVHTITPSQGMSSFDSYTHDLACKWKSIFPDNFKEYQDMRREDRICLPTHSEDLFCNALTPASPNSMSKYSASDPHA